VKPTVTIVIPTRNEGGGIAQVVRAVLPHGDEVLVVDGHSTDTTREISEREGARVVLDGGRGKGDGLRTAIRHAKGDIIVFIDADGSHEASDIPKLVEPIAENRADLVVGSRTKGGSDEFEMDLDNLVRQIGSDLAATLINYRWRVNLTDIQNGFRAIRRSVARSLRLQANDFDIEEEMVMKCLKRGYRTAEVPSHEYTRKWGYSKLPTSKGWKFVWRLMVELL